MHSSSRRWAVSGWDPVYSLIVMPKAVMHRRCRTQKGSEGVGLREGGKVSDSERVGRCRTQKRSEDVGLRECQKVSESVNGTLAENTSDCTDKVIIRLARCPCTNK